MRLFLTLRIRRLDFVAGLLAASLIYLLAFLRCSQPLTQAGGFGSETTNGKLSGIALLPSGEAAAGARIIVRRADYVTVAGKKMVKRELLTFGNASAGKDGHFVVDSLDSGNYMVEINDGSKNALCGRFHIGSEKPWIDIGTNSLRAYAAIRGEVGDSSAGGRRFVQVVGLERLAAVDSNGAYIISDLPEGIFTIRIIGDSSLAALVIENVQTAAGTTTITPIMQWPRWKTISLRTSASAAAISGDVYGFPVLIRLTRSNFSFGEAKKNGEDIRFAKASGAALPYEIEHWDSAGGTAAIWVKVDTVFGNNDSQKIVMLWGFPRAKDNANGGAVFDTAQGFLAVWHLDQPCNDATWNVHDGTNYGAVDTVGMIGNCKKFDGADSIKVPGLLGLPAVVTLSAWVQSDTVRDIGGEIVSIGDDVLMRIDDKQINTATVGAIHTYGDSANPTFFNVSSNRTLTKTGWHFIVFVSDNPHSMQSLYVDGILIQRTYNKNAAIEYLGLGHDTYIGHHANKKNNYNFTGRIDEVRICSVARNADWVKLCYTNQKTVDGLASIH